MPPAATTFAPRPVFNWKLRTRTLPLGPQTLVMGVLNLTPDSFSDGGLLIKADDSADLARVAERALRMLDEGAAILDLGGESTRPGQHQPVSAQQEQDRVLPSIEAILRERPGAILSIDTYKAATARAAIQAGAEIVNDVSGLLWDEDMASACADLQCGLILMHTRGRPDEWRTLPPLEPGDVLPLVMRGLSASAHQALDAGVLRGHIVLDPGFGFGKAFSANYPLLAHLGDLRTLGYPILAGTSRKSFLARTLAQTQAPTQARAQTRTQARTLKPLDTGLKPFYASADAPVEARLNATIASTTACILAGAHVVRVHDVRPAVEAAAIADEILAHA